jgi:hypothetical protein
MTWMTLRMNLMILKRIRKWMKRETVMAILKGKDQFLNLKKIIRKIKA